MDDFGCFYNPRPNPGRCIRDPQSKVVEDKCEKTVNACKLKSTIPPNLPLVVPSSPEFSPQRGKIIVSNGNDLLSGPVSAYIAQIGNKKYEFFGDIHVGKINLCSPPCKDVNVNTRQIEMPLGSEKCWDISALLMTIFTEAKTKKEYVDFYLEVPFVGNVSPEFNKYASQIERSGYLPKLYSAFYECFIKKNCPYDTSRFHYVDIRQYYKSVSYKEFVEQLGEHVQGTNVISEISTFQLYVTKILMKSAIKELGVLLYKNNITSKNKIIEITDKLVKNLYYTEGNSSKSFELFKIYLTSDNFIDDIIKLMTPILSQFDTTDALLFNEAIIIPRLIVNRRGKNMHRVRAQIEALENEGQVELAKKIETFILNKYKQSDEQLIIKTWDKVIKIYNHRFLYSKNTDLTNTFEILDYLKNDIGASSTQLLMDAYTLGRMFRNFPNSNHTDSTKKIVYSGGYHIETYVTFFTNVLNVNIIAYQPNKELKINFLKWDRCLKVNIKDFL